MFNIYRLVTLSSALVTTGSASVMVQLRAVDGSPCISADSKCYLGTTVVIDHGCSTTSECEALVPTFNSTANIDVITDWTQAVQAGITTSGSAAGFRSTVACSDLSAHYSRAEKQSLGYSFAQFSFSTAAAGSYSLKVMMDKSCVGNTASMSTSNAAVNPWTDFASSCPASVTASGACWAVSYSSSVYNYFEQNFPACRGAAISNFDNSATSSSCMNNASHPDVWSPVLMLAHPHGHYVSSSYRDYFFYGRGASQSDSTVKLYFNEPVAAGLGRVCYMAYSSAGSYDAAASVCQTVTGIDATTGSFVSLTGPTTKNRKYYVVVEGNAVMDKAGNYFPGVNGRRFSGTGYTVSNFPDKCAISGDDDAASWPAAGLLHGGHHCEISFVRPLGKPSMGIYPMEPATFPMSSTGGMDLVATPSDSSLCYTFTDSVYWNIGSWSIDSAPASANLLFSVVTNYTAAYGSLTMSTTCTAAALTSNGRSACTWAHIGSSETAAPSMPVYGKRLSAAAPQCWMSPDMKSVCCNVNTAGSAAVPLRSSDSSMSMAPQLVVAEFLEGAIGYAGSFQHTFWVNTTDHSTEKPMARWISWEGVAVDTSAVTVISYSTDQTATFTTLGKTNTASYWQGLQVQWSRSVALNTGFVRFVPKGYLMKTQKTASTLSSSDYWTSTAANPGCEYTHTVYTTPASDAYKAVFGKPCRIPTGNTASSGPADLTLASTDHLIVNPRSLIPGADYNVSVDYGLVKGLADATAMNDQISFPVMVKQSINWGSSSDRTPVAPMICCSVTTTTSWTTTLASIYANMDAGYVHYSQTFLTTFRGPVKVGAGSFMMKCDVDGSVMTKVTVSAMDTDQVIVRGLKLIIDPRDMDHKDKLWMPTTGSAKCFWEAGADAVYGLDEGTQISPYFTVMRGDTRAPKLIDVTPWAPSTCTSTSSPPCVTQADLTMASGRTVSTSTAAGATPYGFANGEDSYITLTFDEMVKFGSCDVTLKASGTVASENGRGKFVWDLSHMSDQDSGTGEFSSGKSEFSSFTNAMPIVSDVTVASSVGATAETSWLSVRPFDLQKAETNTESGAAKTTCTSATMTGFCSDPSPRTYEVVLQLPSSRLAPGDWTLEIPKCSFMDWSVESTHMMANGVESGHASFTGVDVISVPMTVSSDMYAPNITYAPCGPSGNSPQGRKVKGNCFNLAGVEPTSGVPSFYEFPVSANQFEFQGVITGLASTRTDDYFLQTNFLKHTVPVMLEFDEPVTMDTTKKCALAAGFYNTTVSASASARLSTSPLFNNYQATEAFHPPWFNKNTSAGVSYANYPTCATGSMYTDTTPRSACKDARGNLVMSKFAQSYTWLKSTSGSDVKPDSATAGDTSKGSEAASSEKFETLNYFSLGDESFVQYNGSSTMCTSAVGTCTSTMSVDRVFFFLQFDPSDAWSFYGMAPSKKTYYQLSCEAASFKDASGNAADPMGIDYRFTFKQPEQAAALDGSKSYPGLDSNAPGGNKNCTDYATCFSAASASITNTSNIMWAFNQPVQFRPFAYDTNVQWGQKNWGREGISPWMDSALMGTSAMAAHHQLYASFYNGTNSSAVMYSHLPNGSIATGCDSTILGAQHFSGPYSGLCEKNVSITDYAIISADSKKMIFSTKVQMISNYQIGNSASYDTYGKYFGVVAPAGLFGSGNATSVRSNYKLAINTGDETTQTVPPLGASFTGAASGDANHEFKVVYGMFNPGMSAGMYDLNPELLMVLPGATLMYGLMNPNALNYAMNKRYTASGRIISGSFNANPPPPRRAFQQKVWGHDISGFRVGLVMSDGVTLTGDSTKKIKIYDCGEYIRMYGSVVYDPNCNTPAADTADEAAASNYAAVVSPTASSVFTGVLSWGTGVTDGNREAQLYYSVKADGTCDSSVSNSAACSGSTMYIHHNSTVGINYLVDMTWVGMPTGANLTYGHKYTLELDDGVFAANASYTASQSDASTKLNVKTTGLTLKSSGESQTDSATLWGSRVTPWYTKSARPEAVKSKLYPADQSTLVATTVVPQVWFETAVAHVDDWTLASTSGINAKFMQKDGLVTPEARQLNNATSRAWCTGLVCSFYLDSLEYGDSHDHIFSHGLLPGRTYSMYIRKNSIYESNLEMPYLGMPREGHEMFRNEPEIAYDYSFSTREEDTVGPQLLYCCVVSRVASKWAANQCDNGYTFEDMSTNVSTAANSLKFKCVFNEPIMFDQKKGRVFDLQNDAANSYYPSAYSHKGCHLLATGNDMKKLKCTITNHTLMVENTEVLTADKNYTFTLMRDMIKDYSNNSMDYSFENNLGSSFYYSPYCDKKSKTPTDAWQCEPHHAATYMAVPAMVGQDITPNLGGQRSGAYRFYITTQKGMYQDTASPALGLAGQTVAATTGMFAGSATNAGGWPDLHISQQSATSVSYSTVSASVIGNLQPSFMPNDRILLRFSHPIQPYLSAGQTDSNGMTYEDWTASTKIMIQDCGPGFQCNSGMMTGASDYLNTSLVGGLAGYQRTADSSVEVVYGYNQILVNPGGATPVSFTPGHMYRVTVPSKLVKFQIGYGGLKSNGMFVSADHNRAAQYVDFLVSTSTEDRRRYSPLGVSDLVTQYRKNGVADLTTFALIDQVYDDATGPFINSIDYIKAYTLAPQCDKIVVTVSSSSTDPGTNALSGNKIVSGVSKSSYIWMFFPEMVQANTKMSYNVYVNSTAGSTGTASGMYDGVYSLSSASFTSGYYLMFQLSSSSNIQHNGMEYSIGIQNGALFTGGGMTRGLNLNNQAAGTASTTPMGSWENLGISSEIRPKLVAWHSATGTMESGASNCFRFKMASYQSAEQVDLTKPTLKSVYPLNGTLDVNPATMMYLDFMDNYTTLAGSAASSQVTLSECSVKNCAVATRGRSTNIPNELANFQHCCDYSSCTAYGTVNTLTGTGLCDSATMSCTQPDVFWQPYVNTSGVMDEQRTRVYMKMSHDETKPYFQAGKCYVVSVGAGLVSDNAATPNTNDAMGAFTAGTSMHASYWFRTLMLPESEFNFIGPKLETYMPEMGASMVGKYDSISITFKDPVMLDSSVKGTTSMKSAIYLRTMDQHKNDASIRPDGVVSTGSRYINCDLAEVTADLQYFVLNDGDDYTRRHGGPIQLSDDGKTVRFFPQGFTHDNRMTCLIVSPFAIKDASNGNYFKGLQCGEYCFSTAPALSSVEPAVIDYFPRDKDDMSVSDVMNWNNPHWYIFDRNVKAGSGTVNYGTVSSSSATALTLSAMGNTMNTKMPASTTVSGANYMGTVDIYGAQVLVNRQGSSGHGAPSMGYSADAFTSVGGKGVSAMSAATDYAVTFESAGETTATGTQIKATFSEYMPEMYGGSSEYQRTETASGYCNGTLFVVGGKRNGAPSDQICESKDDGMTWSCWNNAIAMRLNSQFACTHDAMYLIGGKDGANGFVKSMDMGRTWYPVGSDMFNPMTVPTEGEGMWMEGVDFPLSGWDTASIGVIADWQVVICGGGLERCWRCADEDCMYWENGDKVPEAVMMRHGAKMFTMGNDLYLIGGQMAGGELFGDVWMSDHAGSEWEMLTANMGTDGSSYDGSSYTYTPRAGSCVVMTGDNVLHVIGGQNTSDISMGTNYYNDYYTSYMGRGDYYDSSWAASNDLYVGSSASSMPYAARPMVIGYYPQWKSASESGDVTLYFSENLDTGKSAYSTRLIWLCSGTVGCSSNVGAAASASTATAGVTYLGVCNATANAATGKGCCRAVSTSGDTVARPVVGSGTSSVYLRHADRSKATMGQSELLTGSCDANTYTEIEDNMLMIKGLKNWSAFTALPSSTRVHVFIPENAVFDRKGNSIYSNTNGFDPASTSSWTTGSTKPTGDWGFEYYFTTMASTSMSIEGFYPPTPSSLTAPTAADFSVALDTNVIFKFSVPIQKYWNQMNKYLRFASLGEYSVSSTSYAMAETFMVPVNDSMMIDDRTVMFKVAPKMLTPGHKYSATLDAKSFVPATFANLPSATLADNDGGLGNAAQMLTFFTVPKITDETYAFKVGTSASAYREAVPPPTCSGTACFVGINRDGNLTLHPDKSDIAVTLAVDESASYPSAYATDVPVPTATDCGTPAAGTFCINFKVVWNQHIKVNLTGNFEIRNGTALKTQTSAGGSATSLAKKISLDTDVMIDELANTTWFQLSSAHGLEAGKWYEIYIPTALVEDYATSPNTGSFKRPFRTLDNTAADTMPVVAYSSVQMDSVSWFKTDVDFAKCAAASSSDMNRWYCIPVNNGVTKNFTFVFSEPVMGVTGSAAAVEIRGGDGMGGFVTVSSPPEAMVDPDSGIVKVSVKDDMIQSGVSTPSDTCVQTTSGCINNWWLKLPDALVQNMGKATACANGDTAACTMGRNNGSVVAASFKTFYPEGVKLLGSKFSRNNGEGFYPRYQSSVDYQTVTKESSIAVQFTKPVMPGLESSMVYLTATHSAYNSKELSVHSDYVSVMGNFMYIDAHLMPGEQYTLRVANDSVRDMNGYLLSISVGDSTLNRDKTQFGVTPEIRFRQNYKTAADNELGNVVTEACGYAADQQASTAKCVGFTPRSHFGVCAASPMNKIVVGGGYCKYCGSFGRTLDAGGRSVVAPNMAPETSNRTFAMKTYRANYASTGFSEYSPCSDVCSTTEMTQKTPLLTRSADLNGYKAMSKFGTSENEMKAFNDKKAPMGKAMEATCYSMQCMDCIQGPELSECVTSTFSTMYDPEDPSFMQLGHNDMVSSYACAPGLHVVGQPDGVRNFNFTCMAKRYGYYFDYPMSSETSMCGSTYVNATCEADRCEGTGAIPNVKDFDANAMLSESDCSAGTRMYMDSCPIECAAGYEPKSRSASYSIDCTATAMGTQWQTFTNGMPSTGDSWGCQPMTCPALKGMMYEGAYVHDGDYSYGGSSVSKSCSSGDVLFTENCVTKCATGYSNGASRLAAMSCSLDGDNGAVSLQAMETCTPLQCSAFSVPSKANFMESSCSAAAFGESCDLTCMDGYMAGDMASTSITCDCDNEECTSASFNLPSDMMCMAPPAPGRSQSVTQTVAVSLAIPDLGDYATVSDYFTGNKPAITGSICTGIINSAFSAVSGLCSQDHVQNIVAYEDFCTESCSSCFVCDAALVESRMRSRRLQDTMNVETTYTIETTAEELAAVEQQAAALATGDATLSAALNDAIVSNLASNSISVDSVTAVAEVAEVGTVAPTSDATTTEAPTTAGPGTEEESSSSAGAVIGGVVGGLVGLGVVGYFFMQRRAKNFQVSQA